jgi:UDP-glucuronate 4-epimerase
MKKILITGCVGFVGFSLASRLLKKKNIIYGIDSIDNYYSKKLKYKRLEILKKNKNFYFYKLDIKNKYLFKKKINNIKFDYIFHFAAQAGVRYSIINPKKYIDSNIKGTNNLLDIIKDIKPKKIFIASSSSVYGDILKFPVKENFNLNPINLYAETKYINEISAKYYSKIYDLNICVLRFFTLYGKWGRPDMFLFKLLKSIHTNNSFYLNNYGNHSRDFTHIDDAMNIVIRLMNVKENNKFNIFNICSNNPINLKKIISILRTKYGDFNIKLIKKNKLDVKKTHGCNKKVLKLTKYKKKDFSLLSNTLENIINWYSKNKIYKIT